VFGPEHLGVANSLNGIGNVLDDMGKVVLLKLS